MSTKPKYAYSYDREDYTGSYDSPEEALAAAVVNIEGLVSPPTEVYVGTIIDVDPQASDHAEAIVDAMARRAHVDYGDPAVRYLKNVKKEQVKELDAELARTIMGWLEKNKLRPTFVKVNDIREYPVPFADFAPWRVTENHEVRELGVSDMPGEIG